VRLAVRGAARVVVPSEPMRARAAELGISAERLAWGVSLADWPPLAPRRREPGAEARLLHVASLNRVKDPWTLVRAAAHLRARGVAFRLDVAGVDTLGGEIQRRAQELGIEDAVRFHGFLTHARLRPLVERADALLVTSRHESACVAVLEAAVAGVPTVGTPVGHLAEWAPGAAVVAPAADPAALADAAAALLADEDRRLCVAAAAQARALAEDADDNAARVLQVYEELTR
jgi:glycosyltransferase involved in cell wall biosynthesis